MKTAILGQAYVARSQNFACDRMVNLFSEMAPSDSKEPAVLYGTPGLKVYSNAPQVAEVRQLYRASNGDAYAVIGNTVYNFAVGVLTSIGTLNTSVGFVSITDNGIQLFMVDGTNGYTSPLSAPLITQIADVDFPNGAQTSGFMDTYFLAEKPASGEFFISAQNDGTSWDSLDFGSAEATPDNIVGFIVSQKVVIIFGTFSTDFFYDSGNNSFPFEHVQGAAMTVGLAAVRSPVNIDNGVMFLGQDKNGQGMVYKVVGTSPQRVSTHAIEFALATYDRIDDAVGWTYQQEGHTFYVLTFPFEQKTWVYDVATSGWHERGSFSNGEYVRWRANCHIFFENKHLVGDYQNGIIYEMSLNTYDENGSPLKWLRSWRQPNNEKKTIFYGSLEIDAEMGVGLDGNVQGSNPIVILRYSNDGGRTWSGEIQGTFGQIGQYYNRCKFFRLGSGRDRVWELSGTDPVKTAIVGAYVNARPGNA